VQPFLPWPGSKAKCSKAIIDEFPLEFGTYHEPFLGSGAIFFAMNNLTSARSFETARLSDTNRNLINCWRAVMERPEHVKVMLGHCLRRNSEEFYGEMRSQMENPSVFLYVMRAAFSSMYRENLKGKFNVPWRKQDFATNGKVISFDMEHLDVCSRYMQSKNVIIHVADWMTAVQDVKAGDLVYFDPPYLPYNETGFVNYTAGGFNEGDHVFLRTQARLLAERGAFVALSNSDVPASRRLYGEPHKILNVTNSVKSTATTKGTRAEGLWIWTPKRV
jgi:DNA adenine methylase